MIVGTIAGSDWFQVCRRECSERTCCGIIRSMITIALLIALLLVPSAHASYWGASCPDGPAKDADIVMVDLRWPAWIPATYYCFWHMRLPGYGFFYGGVAVSGQNKLPGMFQTYWDLSDTIHVGDEFYGKGFGAEGSKGGSTGSPSFQRPNSWYRMVMRVYSPVHGDKNQSYMGWWVKDVEEGKWHTHSVQRLPAKVTGLGGADGGFVEGIGGPDGIPRRFERRLGYCRLNGNWKETSRLTVSHPSEYGISDDGTVFYHLSPPETDTAKAQTSKVFDTKQPPLPTFDPPVIAQAEAIAWKDQVSVKWNVPQTAPPQLGYKLEAFSEEKGKGLSLATYEDAAPNILTKRLDTTKSSKSVKLTVRDIFDQEASVAVPVEKLELVPAAKVAKTRAGLEYVFYQAPADHNWRQLPDFSTLASIKRGNVEVLDSTIRESRANSYAIVFTGYMVAPEDGLYVFSVATSDGSRMSIDGRVVIDHDGVHGPSSRMCQVALAKGLHAFTFEYFKGDGSGGFQGAAAAGVISLLWEGPGFGLREMARNDFVCRESNTPSAALAFEGKVTDGVLDDNLVRIRAAVEQRGNQILKLQLFADQLLLTTKAGSEADKNGNIDFDVLLPEGGNRVWARLWYNDNVSVDSSNVLTIDVKNHLDEPWQFVVMGDEGFPIAVRYKDKLGRFMGEGFGLMYQTVPGDFTMTAHIADLALSTEENGVFRNNWMGLYSQPMHPRSPRAGGNPYGVDSPTLFLTAGGVMKAGADYPDLEGSRMSQPSFNGTHRWLRMVRRDNRFQSYTSADGKTWEKVAERIVGRNWPSAHIGLSFRTVPNKSRSLFQGTFDQITLEQGRVPQELAKTVRKEDLDLDDRMTALVQAPSKPDILYARSSSRGLFKSEDRGETWKAANEGLETADGLAVRSVAVHPEDSSIVLRGGGGLVDGVLKSGLWRSVDGGKTWKLITREIDFDGRGPTTIFGETILFSHLKPHLVLAGGETTGLFISRNAGETWDNIKQKDKVKLKGERITCIACSPVLDKRNKSSVFMVGTFADSDFEALGLGKPVSPVDTEGGAYWITVDAQDQGVKVEKRLGGLGVANVAFDQVENFLNFATTRGIYYTWVHCEAFSQRLHDAPTDELFTALGTRQFDLWSKSTYAAPFSGNGPSPVYLTQNRSRKWSVMSSTAEIKGHNKLQLNAGVSCVWPDKDDATTLFLCNRDGIFKTTDNGETYRLVYEHTDL